MRIRWVATLLAVLAAALAGADTGFIIKNFHSNIEILPDATMTIVETIDVEFYEPRRGIYREIPFRYVDKRGLQRLIDIYGVSVRGETTKVTNQGSNVNIRIGDADIFLPAGTKKSYVISYRVAGGLNFFDKDSQWEPWTELYWNLTGHYWPVPIERSSFQIRFPRASGGEGLRVRGYFGPTFSTSGTPELTKLGTVTDPTGAMRITLTEDRVSGVYDQHMDAYSGTTIVLGLPQTLVPKPPPIAAFKRWLKTYWLIFLPIPIGLILFLRWMAVGRDPKIGPVGVRFEPPVDVDASFAGVLIDDKVDARDISAGIVSLAVKGYLKFVTEDKHGKFLPSKTYLRSTAKSDLGDLSTYEKELLKALKPPFDRLKIKSLSTRLKPDINDLVKKLENELVNRNYYHKLPREVKASVWGPFVFMGFAAVFFGAFLAELLPSMSQILALVIGAILSLPVVAFFAHIMPARTRLGAAKHAETMAFFEAMKGRADYMDWFTQTNLDMAKYEEYLPYAVAFGLVDEWSEICGSVITELPSFCESPSDSVFDYYIWSSSINRSFDTLTREAAAPMVESARASTGSSGWSSGSSGFSGGGFSGGGGGGGGGGSW